MRRGAVFLAAGFLAGFLAIGSHVTAAPVDASPAAAVSSERSRPGADGTPKHRVGALRMDVIQVRAATSWSTVFWRLRNVSARIERLDGTLLRSAASRPGAPAASASSGLRLIAPPGRTTYEPLTALYPRPPQARGPAGRRVGGPMGQHCLCTHLGAEVLGPGTELDGFTTFGRLPADATKVTVTAPRFGTFTGVPVVRGQLPGVQIDATGFAVDGIDRLPYATVLRVRRNPLQPGRAIARPEPLATTPRTPQAAGEVVLIDPATLTSYTALYGDGGGCLCAGFTGTYPEIGVYVFPPLPPTVRMVRVWYTGGLPVDDVAVAPAGPAPAGAPYAPWPALHPAQREVAAYARHDEAVFDAFADRDDMRRDLRTGQATVFFDFDSATPGPRARTALRRLAAELSARPDVHTIQVTGNSDLAGSEGYNLELSGRRARAVVVLLDRWIARPDLSFTVVALGELGAGEDHPTAAERALNRNAVIAPRP